MSSARAKENEEGNLFPSTAKHAKHAKFFWFHVHTKQTNLGVLGG